MPLFNLDGMTVNTIGDPHLGRSFKTGVPLHRLGDREAMVWAEFERQLGLPADLTIIMGDLFDKFVVAPEVTLRAFELIRMLDAAGRRIYILRGNHDASRDAQKASSFDLLKALLGSDESICAEVIEHPRYVRVDHKVFLLCGWEPFRSAGDGVVAAGSNLWAEPVVAAFGHWDVIQHGDDTHNMIPLDQLASHGIKKVFTGHVHKADSFRRQGLEVVVVGSLQPYAHGEQQPGDPLYQTLTPSEVYAAGLESFQNTTLRVLLAPGEEFADTVDCLSFTVKRTSSLEDEQEGVQEVNVGAFDLKTLLGTSCTSCGVSEALQARIHTSLMERMNNA